MPTTPEHSQPDLLTELAESYIERLRKGEKPNADEYVAQYPELAEGIRELFGTLHLVEQLGDRSVFGGESPTQRSTIPSRLGDFQLFREIARGGMGIVFEAIQSSLGRRVAVKVLPPVEHPDKSRHMRFQREARAAANLHHTNIVPVFEVGEQDGICFYAMQFIDGESLAEVWRELRRLRSDNSLNSTHSPETDPTLVQSICRNLLVTPKTSAERVSSIGTPNVSAAVLSRSTLFPPASTSELHRLHGNDRDARPPLPSQSKSNSVLGQDPRSSATNWSSRSGSAHRSYFDNIAGIVLQMVDALEYAHSCGVLHRDIKPANVILDTQCRAWLTDFGLAKVGGDDLTAGENLVGTLRYMSPERFAGEVDARSDVYSAGLMLYEFATMRPAFDAVDQAGMMHLIQHVQPTRPRACEPAIPKDLETIILCAIEKDPARRYATAESLASDLRRFLEGRPLLARRASSWEYAWRWCRRNPVVTSLSAVLLSVILGAWVATFCLWHRADYQWHRADSANGESRAQLEIAESLNDFLQKDLLGQADVSNQAAELPRNTNITVRELLDRASSGIDTRFRGQSRTEAAIRQTLGRTYLALGEFSKAEENLKRSFDLRKESLGDTDTETLESMSNLAHLYLALDRSDEAETLFRYVRKSLLTQFGEFAPNSLHSTSNLAFFHQCRGKYEEAEVLYKQAADGFRKQLGTDHVDTLLTIKNLATMYSKLSRFDEAETLFQQVVKGLRLKLGTDHPETLMAEASLANVLAQRGQNSEAEALYQHGLETVRKTLGATDPTTLYVTNQIALFYRDRGQYEAAEPLLLNVLTSNQTRFGAHHSETLNSMNNLAALYRDQGRFDEAMPLFEQVVEGWTADRGEEDLHTLMSRNNLAMLYQSRGQYDKVEPLLKKTLTGYRAQLGSENALTLNCMSNLGGHYMDRKRYDDAEPLFREALEIRTRTLGADHPDTLTSMNHVALVFNARHDFKAAEPLFLKVLETRKSALGSDHPDTLRTMNNLAQVYRDSDRPIEAHQWFQEVLEARRKKLGDDHPDTLGTLYNFALLEQSCRRLDSATSMLLEAVTGAKKRLGLQHPQTQRMLALLADVYTLQGKPDEAQRWRDELDKTP